MPGNWTSSRVVCKSTMTCAGGTQSSSCGRPESTRAKEELHIACAAECRRGYLALYKSNNTSDENVAMRECDWASAPESLISAEPFCKSAGREVCTRPDTTGQLVNDRSCLSLGALIAGDGRCRRVFPRVIHSEIHLPKSRRDLAAPLAV